MKEIKKDRQTERKKAKRKEEKVIDQETQFGSWNEAHYTLEVMLTSRTYR